MATSLPWNVKGVDPRTRDAARAAARRAGMTLGEWLDSVIRDEASEAADAQTDIAAEELEALSERLSRLNHDTMETAAFDAPAARLRRAEPAKPAAKAAVARKSAEPDDRTAATLDSIARWIEKTEQRLSSSERAVAERQERATSVVADAIKTIGSRIAEIERREANAAQQRQAEAASAPAPAPARNLRPVLSRENLAAAVSDIRLRQRDLDNGESGERFRLPAQLAPQADSIQHAAPAQQRLNSTDELLASLRQDLRDLGARVGAAPAGAQAELQDLRNDLSLLRNDVLKLSRASGTAQIEAAIRDLATKVQQNPTPGALEALTRPISRIEAEINRLSDGFTDPMHQRIEGELSHIAGKIDALASRGSDGRVLAAATRELSAIRDLVSDATGAHRLEDLSLKLADLSADIAQLRDGQVKGRDIDTLRESITDMRKTMASALMAQQAAPSDGGAIVSLSRQIESLSQRIDALPGFQSGDIAAQLAKLMQKLERTEREGKGGGDVLANRIEALVIKLEDLADRAPGSVDERLGSGLSDHLDNLGEKLDRLVGQQLAPREMPGLERKIEAVADRLDQLASRVATPDGTSRLERQIEGMTLALDGLAKQAANPKNAARLESQIESLSTRIEALADSNRLMKLVAREDGAQTVVDMRPLEEMVRALSRKLEEAHSPSADGETLAALEKQVGRLAEKLDVAAAARAENGIEATLQGLIAHFQGLQSETTAAAERAARDALASEFRRVEREESGGIAKLNEAMHSLQAMQDNNGMQTNSALDAVHQTLERIVSRLGALEQDLAQNRLAMSATAPGTAQAAFASADPGSVEPAIGFGPGGTDRRSKSRIWTVPPEERIERRGVEPASGMQSAGMTALDMPLEPGSGRPKAGAAAPDGKTAPTPAPVEAAAPAQGDLRNIIAAARRAAQTVKAEADSAQQVATPGKKPAKAAGSKEASDKRRKPLLLGLAAIVLALGATHVIKGQIGSFGLFEPAPVSQPQAEVASPAPTKAAPPEPPAEKAGPAAAATPLSPPAAEAVQPPAAAPAKEQNSLLSPAPVAPVQAAPFTRQSEAAAGDGTGFVASPSTARDQALASAAPESAPPATLGPVTGLKDLPANLGTAGLRRAALGGDARAIYELAVRAADGVGTARDPKTAMKLFERAAGAGLAPAQFRLGNMFEKGIGAPRDVTLARLWYERAAEKGNAKAMHNLAVLYAEGASGKPDYAMAVEWFKKASEYGMRDSQFNLAVLMARGLGTEQNLVQSWTWFAVGAAQGDEDAAKKRDEVGVKLSPTELAAAKIAVSQWKPKSADPSANEVAAPAQGWDEQTSQPQKRPAKARSV